MMDYLQEKVRARLSSQRSFDVYRKGVVGQESMSGFVVCNMACRSSSRSVVHENAYRNRHHHCYDIHAPPLDHRLHNGLFDFTKPSTKKKNGA